MDPNCLENVTQYRISCLQVIPKDVKELMD